MSPDRRSPLRKRTLDQIWRVWDRLQGDPRGWEKLQADQRFSDLGRHREQLERHSRLLGLLGDPVAQRWAAERLNAQGMRQWLTASGLNRLVETGSHNPAEALAKLILTVSSEEYKAASSIEGGAALPRPARLTSAQTMDRLSELLGVGSREMQRLVDTISEAALHDSLLVESTNAGVAQGQREHPETPHAASPERERRALVQRLVDADPAYRGPDKVRVTSKAKLAGELAYRKVAGESLEGVSMSPDLRRHIREEAGPVLRSGEVAGNGYDNARGAAEAAYDALEGEGRAEHAGHVAGSEAR